MKATKVTIFIGCLLFFQTFLFSQTTYNLITSNSDWSDPNIWSPVGVPGPGDFVIINNKNVTISSGQDTIAGFSLTNGTIFFNGVDPTLTITDSSIWYDGEFDGGNGAGGGDSVNSKFIIKAGAKLIIDTDASPGTHRFYEGITIINQGSITCIGSSNIGIRGLSVVHNEGLFDIQSDADFGGESFSGGTFINTGTFRKSGGSDITSFNLWWIFENQGGTIEVQTGTLQFAGGNGGGSFSGGTYDIDENGTLTFTSGTWVFSGTLTSSAAGVFSLDGAIVNTDSSVVTLDIQGTGFQFIDGDITGGGTLKIPENALFILPGIDLPFLKGGTTLLNQGTIKQYGTTRFAIQGNSVVDNQSIWEITSDADFSGGPGNGGTFLNTGTFRKSAGNDITQMNTWWKFFNQNGGVIDVASGELEFTMTNTNFSNEPGAIIKGVGIIKVPSNFTNNGITAPGNSAGILSYIGNFLPSTTAVLDVQLGGVTETDYDKLNVSGSAKLNGTLKVSLINGFIPAAGDSFVVLTTTSAITDSFVTLDAQSGLYLSIKKNSNNVTIYVDSVGIISSLENDSDFKTVTSYELSQNFPNPFNPSTTIQFALPQAAFVTLEVFNVVGERVDVLLSQELNSGKYNYEWNGLTLTSGVYFYRLQAGSFVETRKMILLK
jgi:hypothetical protein